MNSLDKVIKLSKKIASRFLNGETLEDEELNAFFSESDKEYIKDNLINEKAYLKRKEQRGYLDKEKSRQWKKLKKKGNLDQRVFRLQSWQKVAAIFIGVLSISYLYYSNSRTFPSSPTTKVVVNEITLRLSDGSIQTIDSQKSTQILNNDGNLVVTQKNGNLTYNTENATDELVYNELTVPYGKKIKLSLSDGTVVHLNAGTSLKYPVNFIKGKQREVFLNGEAYFQVAKDSLHPFAVFADELGVRVLGTEFNISSYQEDSNISTVLVEGSVELFDSKKPMETSLLVPGYMAAWNKFDKKISMNKVDVNLYTGWMDGKMVFRRVSFKNMIKKLERSYNVSISSNNEVLNNEIFSATFHVDIENIEKVLEYINLQQPFTYTIKEKQITIN